MKIETPSAIAMTNSILNHNASRDWAPGVVKSKSGIAAVIRTPFVGTISLLLLGCLPAFAYSNLGNGVTQSDGSASDTQAAVNAAAAGSTVQIPNGSYDWGSTGVVLSKPVKLLGQSIGGVTLTSSTAGATIITINKSAAGSIEVGNISFVWPYSGWLPSGAYPMITNGSSGLQPFLIHDCQFHATGTYDIRVQGNGGVIWNCTMDTGGSASGGYGIDFQGYDFSDWTTPDTMGTADANGSRNTYVEDCTFTDMYVGCINADDCSRVVFRHNTCNNTAVATHGQETSPQGLRHLEVYNNVFIYSTTGVSSIGIPYPLNLNYWVDYRGGTGVVTGNTLPQITVGSKTTINLNCFGLFRPNSYYNCVPSGGIYYPCPRQVGIGWNGTGPYSWGTSTVWNADGNLIAHGLPPDGTGYFSDPLYVWGNSGSGASIVATNQEANEGCNQAILPNVNDYIKLGRDYFVGTARPGWIPYTYPHPLRNGSASSSAPTPLAPQNLRVGA